MRQERTRQGREAVPAAAGSVRAWRWTGLLGMLALVGCASGPRLEAEAALTALPHLENAPPAAGVPVALFPGWRGFSLPGKRLTDYQLTRMEGRSALHARSDRSASMVRRVVRTAPADLGAFSFSWWVPTLMTDAVLGDRDRDDAPVRVVLAFDGDHAKLSMRERLQFDLAETLTGERPPYATLMYVWDPSRPTDAVIMSPRTERIRKVVVETGTTRLKRWVDYRRDVIADFRRVYGEEPGALLAVGVMTDSDNTQTQAEAWYGEPAFSR